MTTGTSVTLPKVNLGTLWSFISKFGGAALAAQGLNNGNHWQAIISAAFALGVHVWDSMFNSPKGVHPVV